MADDTRQVKQSIILGRLLLALARAIHRDYRPEGKHIGEAFGEVLVGTSVLVRDHRRRGKPLSTREIEKLTGIPRRTVRRYAGSMVSQGILIKHARGGYTFCPDYIPKRQDRTAFRHAINAVLRAARELQKVK